MIVDAIVQNGMLVPKLPLMLPEGTAVRVLITTEEQSPLVWLGEHAVAGEITDLAEQHDHYAYGTPRRPPMKHG